MQYTLPLGEPTPDQPFNECDEGSFIGVDADPYRIRLTHCAGDGTLLDTLEAMPHQTARVTNWIRKRRRKAPDLELTGYRKDRWPPGLLPVLTEEFGPICWVPDGLWKKTIPELQCADRLQRFFRGALIAACAQAGQETCDPNPHTVLDRWRRAVLQEMTWALNDFYCDDIPF